MKLWRVTVAERQPPYGRRKRLAADFIVLADSATMAVSVLRVEQPDEFLLDVEVAAEECSQRSIVIDRRFIT